MLSIQKTNTPSPGGFPRRSLAFALSCPFPPSPPMDCRVDTALSTALLIWAECEVQAATQLKPWGFWVGHQKVGEREPHPSSAKPPPHLLASHVGD